MPSDGSHLGSVSADSIGLDSIGDPLADGLSDQAHQERGGEGLNLAAELEILVPEFGSEDPVVNFYANGKEGRDGTIPKGRSGGGLLPKFRVTSLSPPFLSNRSSRFL